MKPIIVNSPEYNRPTRCTCAKCGKTFMNGAWTGTYSKLGNHYYRYENSSSCGLVTLCDSCADEELAAKRVGMILY